MFWRRGTGNQNMQSCTCKAFNSSVCNECPFFFPPRKNCTFGTSGLLLGPAQSTPVHWSCCLISSLICHTCQVDGLSWQKRSAEESFFCVHKKVLNTYLQLVCTIQQVSFTCKINFTCSLSYWLSISMNLSPFVSSFPHHSFTKMPSMFGFAVLF